VEGIEGNHSSQLLLVLQKRLKEEDRLKSIQDSHERYKQIDLKVPRTDDAKHDARTAPVEFPTTQRFSNNEETSIFHPLRPTQGEREEKKKKSQGRTREAEGRGAAGSGV
jgi:hypothetical protein